jgi:DNA-binding CsgD family transcriptional regulator
MNKYRLFLFLLPALFGYLCAAQELPPIQNFTPLDYHAGNQNWAIAQSQDKVMYIANNEGLIVFNGAFWKRYPSPNGSIMRSVLVNDEKIYTGCYMEFGFWQTNKFGLLTYTSLSDQLQLNLLEDEEFWNIIALEGFTIFQSLSRIYIYNEGKGSVEVIESSEVIRKLFKVGGHIYFQRMNKGIYQIENGHDILLSDQAEIKNTEVINIFEVQDELVLLTRDKGFFSYHDGSLEAWNTDISTSLLEYSIYSAIQLNNGDFALGTISNGLIYLNTDHGIAYQVNQSNGISNNTVLALFQDADDNIWLGLDNGISYINTDAPIKIFRDMRGILGSVYASAIVNTTLYLGTNQGLFYKPMHSNVPFELIDNTQGQVWSLKVIDGELFCGHHDGTFLVTEDSIKKIADVAGTWNIKSLSSADNLIIQGNYDGLYVLEKVNGSWKLRNKVDGFNYSSRSFEVLNQRIFVNHEYRGHFNLTVDDAFSKVVSTKVDTLLKGENSGITKYQGQILYAYNKGVFKFNEQSREFERDNSLSEIYSEEEYTSGQIVADDGGERFWVFTRDNLTLVSSVNLVDQPKVERIPVPFDIRRDVVDYENITSIDGDNNYLLGTTYGYMMLDVGAIAVKDFQVQLSPIKVGLNEKAGPLDFFIEKNETAALANDENNLVVHAYTPEYYKYFQPTYQFKLLGLYDTWSEWSSNSLFTFSKLAPSNYTLQVRAKIGNKLSSNIASYEFSIAQPWYLSYYMLAVYVIAIITFSLLLHYMYRTYYHRQRQKIIAQKNKEFELSKLQNEKEIIDMKNAQLQMDYKSKSKELAASTMGVVRKNELLTQIKSKLVEIGDKQQLAPVIKIIDQNLSHNKNWKLFTEAFNNADSEFFRRMKVLHPDLTPNDLKLCAYLRLNMSSKEMAPLFNISPASVEIKRYRLRKKMKLDKSQNLTEYILSV